jgi:hypothetical protein
MIQLHIYKIDKLKTLCIYIHYTYMLKTKEIMEINKEENTFYKTKNDTDMSL